MKESVLKVKSKVFAVRIVRLYQWLDKEQHEHIMAKQLLRAGTSVGANVYEACFGQSKKDFLFKLQIALKECHETLYWLELLTETEYLTQKQSASMLADCEELLKILHASIKTTKENILK